MSIVGIQSIGKTTRTWSITTLVMTAMSSTLLMGPRPTLMSFSIANKEPRQNAVTALIGPHQSVTKRPSWQQLGLFCQPMEDSL